MSTMYYVSNNGPGYATYSSGWDVIDWATTTSSSYTVPTNTSIGEPPETYISPYSDWDSWSTTATVTYTYRNIEVEKLEMKIKEISRGLMTICRGIENDHDRQEIKRLLCELMGVGLVELDALARESGVEEEEPEPREERRLRGRGLGIVRGSL